MKHVYFDFEVFKNKWIFVALIDNRFKIIIDKVHAFVKFFEAHQNDLWIGYNNKNYDNWIIKALLKNANVYEISKMIIDKDPAFYKIKHTLNNINFHFYDCVFQTGLNIKSLKEVLALAGKSILEFDFPKDNILKDEDVEKCIEYCKNDIKYLPWIVKELKNDEMAVKLMIIKNYNFLPKYINYSYAFLTSQILNAQKIERKNSFVYDTWPKNLDIKNHKVLDFYSGVLEVIKKLRIKDKAEKGNFIFGLGGLHYKRKVQFNPKFNYYYLDVNSYYPTLIINFNLFSRNSNEIGRQRFIDYYKIRMNNKNKHLNEEEKRQDKLIKIVLNTAFGAMNYKHNALYDPKMSHAITITGQLILWDLIEKINENHEVVYCNTDAVLIKANNLNELKEIIENWKSRFNLQFEIKKVLWFIIKDSNNYIFKFEKGVDFAGAQIKNSNLFLEDKEKVEMNNVICHNAVLNFFINQIIPEETIKKDNNILHYQLIRKIGNSYDTVFVEFLGEQLKINRRVNRIFAAEDKSLWGKVYKIKNITQTPELVADLPKHCLIANDKLPLIRKIDKKWYIHQAWKYIGMFNK